MVLWPHAARKLNNCCRLLSTNALGIRLFGQSKLQSRSNNNYEYGFSREPQVKSDSDIDLEIVVSEKFRIKSVLLVAARLLIF